MRFRHHVTLRDRRFARRLLHLQAWIGAHQASDNQALSYFLFFLGVLNSLLKYIENS